MEEPYCQVHLLGRTEYQRAWKLQEAYAGEIAAGIRPPTLLLLEHPHTFTFGSRGRGENLLWDAAEVERRGVSVYWVDRGGDVTYHGPGQLVGYPLLPLAKVGVAAGRGERAERIPQADFVGYVRRLEQMLILALGRLGVEGRQVAGLTGVWVQTKNGPAKIAAIGVKVDARGVSRHGFALNVNPDMSYWQGIVGCGLEGIAVTSLAEQLGESPAMEMVIQAVVAAFGRVYHVRPVWFDKNS